MPAPRLAANDSGMIQIKLKPKTPLNAMAMATATPHAAPEIVPNEVALGTNIAMKNKTNSGAVKRLMNLNAFSNRFP